jgi:hypothetical protein
MITITAPVWLWSEGKGSWHFLTIPPDRAIEIRLAATAAGPRRGFGSVRVAPTIGGVTWRTSLFPQKDGGYILPIKAAVRSKVGIAAGDTVSATLDII